MKALINILGLFTILFASVINSGIAASLSWNLFVPRHFDLPELPVLLAIALSSVVSIFAPTPNTQQKSEGRTVEEFANDVYASFLLPWLAYFVVWIATSVYY